LVHSPGASLFKELEAFRGLGVKLAIRTSTTQVCEPTVTRGAACTRRHVCEMRDWVLFQHDGTHRGRSTQSTLLVCVHRHNLNAAAAIAANTVLHSLHVLVLAAFTQQLARAGLTVFRLVFAGWCELTRTKSSHTIVTLQGPEFRASAPHNVQRADRADEDGQADVWVQKSIHRDCPFCSFPGLALFMLL
jgi:hypothetical protein